MNKFYLAAFACISIIGSYAQEGEVPHNNADTRKYGLFKQLPDSIPVDISSLETLLTLSAGSEVVMDISRSGEIPINGIVIANSNKYNGRINSVSLRSSMHEGAIFHLSKSVLDNGQNVYRGTWIHKDYSDIYTLSYNGKEYALLKKKFRDLIME